MIRICYADLITRPWFLIIKILAAATDTVTSNWVLEKHRITFTLQISFDTGSRKQTAMLKGDLHSFALTAVVDNIYFSGFFYLSPI